ncbi:MAG: hypothetical protein JF617_08960 [Burkholderiales bacterium]|nr:hypothetical protein [Burkholderiales bacterium]
MTASDFTLLQLLRDGRLSALETHGGLTRMVVEAPDLGRRLGGTERLRIDLRLIQPLVLDPWIGEASLPLTEVLAQFDIFLLGVHVAHNAPAILQVAATPKDEAPQRVNGGDIALSGELVAMSTDEGRTVSEAALRQAATERVAAQMAAGPGGELKRRLSEIVAKAVAPILKHYGFIERSGRYARLHAPVAQSVEMLSGRWNAALGLAFSFELGVFVGEFGGKLDKPTLTAHGGPALILSVAALWNRPGQQYALRPDTPWRDLARRLQHDFGNIVGPWLQATSTIDGIVGFLESEARTETANANALHAALLLAKVGRQDEARRRLANAPESRETILQSAHRYGVRFEL